MCPSAFSSFSRNGLLLMTLSFKTVWKVSLVLLSRYRFKRSLSIQSFSLGRCQGWLSMSLDEGSCSVSQISCSDGLLLLHPQLSVQHYHELDNFLNECGTHISRVQHIILRSSECPFHTLFRKVMMFKVYIIILFFYDYKGQ